MRRIFLALMLVLFLTTGAEAAPVSSTEEVERISQRGLKLLMESQSYILIILDVREGPAYRASTIKIPGAMRMPLHALDKYVDRIPRNKIIVTYCSQPNEKNSAEAAMLLLNNGFENARALEEGFEAWVFDGNDVVRK